MLLSRRVLLVVAMWLATASFASAAWPNGNHVGGDGGSTSITFSISIPNQDGKHFVNIVGGEIDGHEIVSATPVNDEGAVDPNHPQVLWDHMQCHTRQWRVENAEGEEYIVWFSCCQSALGGDPGDQIGSIASVEAGGAGGDLNEQ